MSSFDSELRALIDKWRTQGEPDDSICDALETEFELLEEAILQRERAD